MASTHTPINVQKKNTRTDAAVPPLSNAACQCPVDKGVCRVHGKQTAGGHTGVVPALRWSAAVICKRRASSRMISQCQPAVGEHRVCLPETRHQTPPRHIIM